MEPLGVRIPLLRTRGGISGAGSYCAGLGCSSPHTRRYFPYGAGRGLLHRLFSAHAEVFPIGEDMRADYGTLLRTRGGISKATPLTINPVNSSPHTRRYFPLIRAATTADKLFSAHAEVFPSLAAPSNLLAALLRTRGGISFNQSSAGVFTFSSPHTRRYFRPLPNLAGYPRLFSAHAEVFPSLKHHQDGHPSLLRTRGGISRGRGLEEYAALSSPHTRRYFHLARSPARFHTLFSAHAEVFPHDSYQPARYAPLLRTRGGISMLREVLSRNPSSSPHTRRYFQNYRVG